MTVLHVTRSGAETLALFVAERYLDRLVGLAGIARLPDGTGLLIPGCRSVHTFGMRFPVDVLFVTLDGRSLVVHESRRAVPPGRIVRASPTVRVHEKLAVLELPARRLRQPGPRLEPHDPAQALRQVPVPVADQLHRRRDEHRPDDRRIEQDRGRETDSELL